MWTDFNHSFTVIFAVELQKKVVFDLPPHLKFVAALRHYLEKTECSTAQLFIHISQNNRTHQTC